MKSSFFLMKKLYVVGLFLLIGLFGGGCQNLYNTEQPEFEVTEVIPTFDNVSHTVEFEIKGVCVEPGWKIKRCIVQREPPEKEGFATQQTVWITPYFKRDESNQELSFSIKHTEEMRVFGTGKFDIVLFPAIHFMIRFMIGTKKSYESYSFHKEYLEQDRH